MLVLLLGLAIALADQVVKYLVRFRFHLGESIPVIPGFFSLTYVRNTGAAWGLFDGSNLALAVFSFVALAGLTLFRRHFLGTSRLQQIALGLMAGGILGNLFDRVRLGYVVDFLHFYWRSWHFPSFNIADAAICTGVAVYLIVGFRSESA